MKIKFCGITRVEDGVAALDAGATMLGFNFYRKSARFLETPRAAGVIRGIRAAGGPFIAVGIFVDAGAADMLAVAREAGLDAAQLSGDEDPRLLDELEAAGLPCFKAIRPEVVYVAEAMAARYARPGNPARGLPELLLDAAVPGSYGGSGVECDWEIAALLASKRAILLAGGLGPANAGRAARTVAPWGLDAASGIESSPGIKDAGKMKLFAEAALAAGGGK